MHFKYWKYGITRLRVVDNFINSCEIEILIQNADASFNSTPLLSHPNQFSQLLQQVSGFRYVISFGRRILINNYVTNYDQLITNTNYYDQLITSTNYAPSLILSQFVTRFEFIKK